MEMVGDVSSGGKKKGWGECRGGVKVAINIL